MPKNLNEKELQELLELAQESEHKARAMCELITIHSAKYKRWSEEAEIKKLTALKQSPNES